MLPMSITHPKLSKKLRELSMSNKLDKDNKDVFKVSKDETIKFMLSMGLIAIPTYFINNRFKN